MKSAVARGRLKRLPISTPGQLTPSWNIKGTARINIANEIPRFVLTFRIPIVFSMMSDTAAAGKAVVSSSLYVFCQS